MKNLTVKDVLFVVFGFAIVSGLYFWDAYSAKAFEGDYVDETSNRSTGADWLNSSDQDIFVNVTIVQDDGPNFLTAEIGTTTLSYYPVQRCDVDDINDQYCTLNFVVPIGYYYRVSTNSGGSSALYWWEYHTPPISGGGSATTTVEVNVDTEAQKLFYGFILFWITMIFIVWFFSRK